MRMNALSDYAVASSVALLTKDHKTTVNTLEFLGPLP